MFLITRADNAKGVAARWKDVYFRNGQWHHGPNKQDIWHGLNLLGENPSADDVDAVIGNISWTEARCDECDKCFESVVSCGQYPDYESATAKLCKGCLKKALKLLP